MDTITIESINYGDYYIEEHFCEFLENFDNGILDFNDDYICLKGNNKTLTSKLSLFENDVFFTTWKGTYSDGTSFRVVCPKPSFKTIMGNTITIASLHHNGYAVHFNIE